MRYEAKSRGLRADLSLSDLREIVAALAVAGDTELLADMRRALEAQTDYADAQRRRRADRRAARHTAAPSSDPLHRIVSVDGFCVAAHECDVIDLSRDPDVVTWARLDQAATPPDQAEIRRNVRMVSIFLQPGLHYLAGGFLMDDARPLESFARELIASAEHSVTSKNAASFTTGGRLMLAAEFPGVDEISFRANAASGSAELLRRIQQLGEPTAIEVAERIPETAVPIGTVGDREIYLDLAKLLAGRCLIQGSSGAGKSATLRKIVEEAFDYATVMIVDPEGEFHNLAAHIGATTLRAVDLSTDGLTAAAARGREHRLALHVDLTDLEPEQRVEKAAAFFAGLIASPREHWANTVLVCVDEAHLLAPHVAASVRDAEIRKLGVATLTDLCSRGRKRGIGTVLATQRLAKLAGSVVSELHNVLIGLNIFDRDVTRAADLLGFGSAEADQLRHLRPGEFFAFGPALSSKPVLTHIAEAITPHVGAAPSPVGAADIGADEARRLLDLGDLQDLGARRRDLPARGSARSLDTFLLEPAAPSAIRIVEALRKIAPNATTAADLVRHLGLDRDAIDGGLDLLGQLGAVDTMPKGDQRIARLSARLRLRVVDAPVVGLA